MPKLKMWTLLLGLILVAITPVASAQDEKAQKSDDTKTKAASSKPLSAYRLEYTLSEIENGKKINTRSYTMVAEVGDNWNKLRIGTRLPVASETGANRQFQYLDIGMNIDCRLLREQDGYLLLDTTIDSSYISQASTTRDPVTLNQPVIDQAKTSVSTMVSLGKPTVISSMDALSSKRTYQIEVTATKVK